MFDTAVRQIYAQGGPAGEDGGCLYRTDDGRKCNLGACIPDEMYSPEFEGKAADHARLEPVIAKLLPDDTNADTFVRRLQEAHDDAFNNTIGGGDFFGLYAENMREFAKRYALSAAALDECESARKATGAQS